MCVIRTEVKEDSWVIRLGRVLDTIAGRDKLVRNGIIEAKKLRRKGKNNPKNHKETRGRINDCKTIHQRVESYPKAPTYQEYGHFKGDTFPTYWG